MKYPVMYIKLLPAAAIAIFPFILLKKKSYRTDLILLNHERIHLRQQLELFIIPFYLLYLLNYVVNLIQFKNHDKAYYNIVFEREAFMMDKNLEYLKKRKFWSWVSYISSDKT
jgi:hypothetical protein